MNDDGAVGNAPAPAVERTSGGWQPVPQKATPFGGERPNLLWPMPAQGDLLDINVWLALAVEEHPHHAPARAWWAEAASTAQSSPWTSAAPAIWFCRVTMLGLVRLLCQPKVVGEGALTLAAALGLYGRFRALPIVGLLPDAADCEARLAQLVNTAPVSSPLPPRLWTDAYLAATAQSAGLRLVTFDTDFRRFGADRCLVLART